MPNPFRTVSNTCASWFPEVDKAIQANFQNALTRTNIQRLRTIAWLIIAFNLILVVIHLAFIDNISAPRILEMSPYILGLRVFFIKSSLAFIIATRRHTIPDSIKRQNKHWWLLYVLVNLIGFALLSGLIHSAGPGIASSYLMAILVVAAFIYLNWSQSVAIYSSLIWIFQMDWLVAFSAFINASFVTVMALVISRITYNNRIWYYVKKVDTKNERTFVPGNVGLTWSLCGHDRLVRHAMLDLSTSPNREISCPQRLHVVDYQFNFV